MYVAHNEFRRSNERLGEFFFLNIPKWIIIVRDLKIKLSVVPVIIGVLKYIIIKYNVLYIYWSCNLIFPTY